MNGVIAGLPPRAMIDIGLLINRSYWSEVMGTVVYCRTMPPGAPARTVTANCLGLICIVTPYRWPVPLAAS